MPRRSIAGRHLISPAAGQRLRFPVARPRLPLPVAGQSLPLRVVARRALKGLAFATLASAALTAPQAARASPTDAPGGIDAAAGAEEAATPDRPLLETTRRTVRATTEWLARGVDSWFGNRPFDDGGQVSQGRLSVGVLKRFGDRTESTLRFNARFRLPNIEERAYVFVGRDDEREVVSDRPDPASRPQRLVAPRRDEQSFIAGLGLELLDSIDLRLGFRGGLKPYAQARYLKDWPLSDADLLTFKQTVFWSVDDHLGSTTAVSLEHAYSSVLAVRWLNTATITRRTDRFEWSSVLGSYRSFGHQRLLSLEALVTGVQGSGEGVSDAGLRAKWEQPVYKDWLIGEVVVGHFWPRPDQAGPRDSVWALGGGLRMKF